MSATVVRFPGSRPIPTKAAVDTLLEQVTAAEVELARARVAQIRSEVRQNSALFAGYWIKKALFWGIVLWILSALFGGAKAEQRTTTFYGKTGSFEGQSYTVGRGTSYSDRTGSFVGSSTRRGNSVLHYDRTGSFIGSTTGPRR